MGYRYLDDFRRSISLLAIFSYGFWVLGTPNVALLYTPWPSRMCDSVYFHLG